MLVFFFQVIKIRNRGPFFDASLVGDCTGIMRQGFRKQCLAGARMAHKGHVTDLRSCILGHEFSFVRYFVRATRLFERGNQDSPAN